DGCPGHDSEKAAGAFCRAPRSPRGWQIESTGFPESVKDALAPKQQYADRRGVIISVALDQIHLLSNNAFCTMALDETMRRCFLARPFCEAMPRSFLFFHSNFLLLR